MKMAESYPDGLKTLWEKEKLLVMKDFVDNNFKFDENGRKLSNWVENTVGKGEIAHYKQFLLFPQCFQKACFPGASKGVIVGERVNSVIISSAAFEENLSYWLSPNISVVYAIVEVILKNEHFVISVIYSRNLPQT